MSPTLVLLRLLAVLLVPLLVVPSVVSLGRDVGTPVADTSATPVRAAADGISSLPPPTTPASTPTPDDETEPAATEAPAADREADEPSPKDDQPVATDATPAAKDTKAPKDDEPAAQSTKAAAKGEKGNEQPAKGKEAAATDEPDEKGRTSARADAPKAKARQKAAAEAKPKGKGRATDEREEKPGAKGKGKAEAKKARAKAAAAPPAPSAPRSLYLAIGHGRAPDGTWQPGAEHPGSGAFEVDAAQIMVEAMTEVLRDVPGLELHVESGEHPNVIGSVANANALGVDDCIEVHQDTAAAPPGVFGHWFAGVGPANRLADRLVGAVADHGVPVRHDWHRARSGLYWVRKSDCRAVLMEVGRVGDFGPKQLRAFGRSMAEAYLADIS